MARTFHHGDRNKERTYGEDWKYWGWLRNYPGWWDTIFHHAPARRKERDLLSKVLSSNSGHDPADGHWPDHRRPHKHYW